MAADVGEHFAALVVRAEETDNVAVTGAAIEIVVAVEDDVLRPLDLAKANNLHRTQLVVERVRRARIERGRRGRKRQISRRHIDLGEPLVAIAQEAHVDEDRGDEHAAQYGGVRRPGDTEASEAVGDDQDEQRAHDRLGDPAAPSAKRIAAEDRRGQRGDLEPHACVGPRAADAGGEQDPASALRTDDQT